MTTCFQSIEIKKISSFCWAKTYFVRFIFGGPRLVFFLGRKLTQGSKIEN
jgi:hypothetical protein